MCLFSLTYNPLGLHLKMISQMNDTFVCTCRPFLLPSLPVLSHRHAHTGTRARAKAAVISATPAVAAAATPPFLYYPPLFFRPYFPSPRRCSLMNKHPPLTFTQRWHEMATQAPPHPSNPAHAGVMPQSLFHCSGPTRAYFTNHAALSPGFCLDDLNK